jgi:hypothetical protein
MNLLITEIFENIKNDINIYENIDFINILDNSIIKQICEILKLSKIFELILTLISEKKLVLVFLNYSISIDILQELLNKKGINYGLINNENDYYKKKDNVKNFQNNKLNLLIILLKSSIVGLNLHDKKGKNTRASIISLHENDIDIAQIIGRTYRINTKSDVEFYFILLKDKLDEKIFENFITKENEKNNINLINNE